MKFKEIINEKLKRKYEFTLKASDLNKEVDQQLEKEQPSIQMKGFRKGKVPISLLKKMHGEALLSEAMKSATDTAVKDHFEKKGDKPAYEPKIDLINKNGFYEYYSCKNGKAMGAKNFSWSAALYLDFVLNRS